MEEDARIIGASALLRSAVELDEAAFLAEVQAESIRIKKDTHFSGAFFKPNLPLALTQQARAAIK